MSVEIGGGSAEVWSAGQAPREADQQVITSLYDTYAVHLFDYCAGVLRNPAAAADAVQDTLVAADAQMGKLRDPARLRAWLYCMARRQCLSDLPRGAETSTPDALFAGWAGRPDASTAEFAFPDIDAEALAKETLLVVAAAVGGLSDQDQEVVNLAFQHGIAGADLATVLGTSGRRAAALLSGASARFEDSTDAITVLRANRAVCGVLKTIAGDWDPASPRLTPELRKRLTRHIGNCDDCARSRGDILGPELLGALRPAALPAGLREQITRTVFDTEPDAYRRSVARRSGKLDDDGFPVLPQAGRNLPRAMAAAAAVVVLIVGGVMFHQLTSASAVGSDTTAAVANSPAPVSASASVSLPAVQKTHRRRHAPRPLLGPTPGPTGVLLLFPTPTPSPTASPKPSHSRTPSPKPTGTKTPTPTPSPSTTTPTPTPTPTPSPSTTTPTPTPTTTPTLP
jgi:RNA polymerase sigma factor (sigma-70 family)